jgi:hydrogenase-4 membrane subunit HyfE
MLWIEAKSTIEIALFVFSIAYLVAAVIFCFAATLSRHSVAKDLKAIVPVSLTTPLGVILGLLIAFHASRVWTNLDHAIEYVGQEASALREAVLLAAALPPEVSIFALSRKSGRQWPASRQPCRELWVWGKR